jgi:hypothetical protein
MQTSSGTFTQVGIPPHRFDHGEAGQLGVVGFLDKWSYGTVVSQLAYGRCGLVVPDFIGASAGLDLAP